MISPGGRVPLLADSGPLLWLPKEGPDARRENHHAPGARSRARMDGRNRCAGGAPGAGKYVRIDRSSVKFPPTDFNRIGQSYTSLCGTVVRIEIDRSTGALRIAKAYSVLECGQALVPEVVIGQAQGGFAMGVGYTLLETLPLYEDGPGNGKWNLGQYLVARGSDLPLNGLEVEVLPPVAPDERPKAKGAAEDWPAFAKLFEQMREGKPDELARRICHLAMEGERDPVRLHDQALGELIPATMWRELS